MLAFRAVALGTLLISCTANDAPIREGSDPNACSAQSAGENAINGFDFLQVGVQFNLVMTSVELLTGFTAEMGKNIQCVSVTTDGKDNGTNQSTLTVYYKWAHDGSWHEFGQTFQFTQYRDGLNRMSSVEVSGAPSGTYSFEYATLGCAVVEVTHFGTRMSEVTGRDTEQSGNENAGKGTKAENEGTQGSKTKPQCMVWAYPHHVRGTENCCERYFSEKCEKNKNYEYSTSKCPALPSDSKVDL